MLRKSRLVMVALAALVVTAILVLPAMAAPVTGVIFTTTEGGDTVNGNIYETNDAVYLNGGPQPNAPCSAAGLPDGDYYFQSPILPGPRSFPPTASRPAWSQLAVASLSPLPTMLRPLAGATPLLCSSYPSAIPRTQAASTRCG